MSPEMLSDLTDDRNRPHLNTTQPPATKRSVHWPDARQRHRTGESLQTIDALEPALARALAAIASG